MIGGERVAQVGVGRRRTGQDRFECDDRVRVLDRSRRIVADIRQLHGYVVDVRGANRGVARQEIIVAVGQPQPAEANSGDRLRRVALVGLGGEAQTVIDPQAIEIRDRGDHSGGRRDRVDAVEVGLQRLQTAGLDRGDVAARGVKRADASAVGIRGRRGVGRGFGEDRAEEVFVAFLDLVEGAPGRMTRRNFRPAAPAPGRIAPEIIAGIAGGVEVGRIEYRRGRERPRKRGGGRRPGKRDGAQRRQGARGGDT